MPSRSVFVPVIILERTVKGVSAASLARFARRAHKLAGLRGDVNVLISGDRRLQKLNRVFRAKNCPTDVLSFPDSAREGGDIAISADLARCNASRYGHSAGDELRILILHGMLHLAGLDHETDHGQMARLETRLRSELGLPIALIERASFNGHRTLSATKRRAKGTTSARSRRRR